MTTTNKSCYLAGPISGLDFATANYWRKTVTAYLKPEISCFSPLRGQEPVLSEQTKIEQSYNHPLLTDRAITARDHLDCMNSDLIFCNLLRVSRVSVGTCMEIAWAFAYRKPLVLVIEEENNLHDHPMIRGVTDFRVSTLEAGIKVTKAILLP
jgi:nucleoside 2-deoxyribosyltransferase